ncbi:MAG: hypothetical protein JNN01_26870 [Opitutaceae bacterium]|nr:hypothetical protein [Opitutaceae bacterium]
MVPTAARQLPPPVTQGKQGALDYLADAKGNRVPDFSHAGYGGGGVRWPDVTARVVVGPVAGDDGSRIQAALDQVAALPPDAQGLRGAVELEAGTYEVSGQLRITVGGVVLRGAGPDPKGTVLVATGAGRRALIEVAGSDRRVSLGPTIPMVSSYVPVGATRITVADAAGLKSGMSVTVRRPSPANWIAAVGMDDAPGRQPYSWKPGTVDVAWDRSVVAIEGNSVVLDVPLTLALESEFGGGTLTPYRQDGYLEKVGVENLRCVSEHDRSQPLDEDHAWNAIDLHAVRDAWIANVTALHFCGSVVQVGAKAARVTVQDCASLDPVSEKAGYRRMAFHSRGQQVLFLRCTSERGCNDFTCGYQTAGPTVFLDCSARETSGFSGSIGSWSSGMLFDGVKIDGGALRLDHLETWHQGVGWSAANSMAWGCEASVVICRSPPGATNWAVAVWGQFVGDGRWSMVSEFPRPVSLYRAQLAHRCGTEAVGVLDPKRYRLSAVAPRAEPSESRQVALPAPGEPGSVGGLKRINGWLTVGGGVLTGSQTGGAWWLGRLEPARASEFGPALTRFAPGRTGTGLTDEIPAVVAGMVSKGQVAFRHHYGLWYDRRRIDHQMIRRSNADVSPPFFEQPFARSGVGTAWDGLSRYDLTRFNPWYFARLQAFADEAKKAGLILIHEMYFQHNILESGAHWVDCPWRPVNNVNGTDFVEPPPFVGDTIKMAEAFYDVSHPVRRALHRGYIRHCLQSLADHPNVIHTLSAENSGPLPFMRFWFDVIAEWEQETGKRVLLALSAPKDVQEAILSDPVRGPRVDVIDLAYWFRTPSGKEFAPEGGTRLAPRQHERLWKGGRPSAASIADMVRELRQKFPEKAVISPLPEADGWLFAAAGGSLAKLPRQLDARLRAALVAMRPLPDGGLAEPGRQGFYAVGERPVRVELGSPTSGYVVRTVDPETGQIGETRQFPGDRALSLDKPGLYWITCIPSP